MIPRGKALFVTLVLREVVDALFLEDDGQSDKLLFMCIRSQGPVAGSSYSDGNQRSSLCPKS